MRELGIAPKEPSDVDARLGALRPKANAPVVYSKGALFQGMENFYHGVKEREALAECLPSVV